MRLPYNFELQRYYTVQEFLDAMNAYGVKIRIEFPNDNVILTEEDFSLDGGITIRQVLNPDESVNLGHAVSTEVIAYIINSDKVANIDWTQQARLLFAFRMVGSSSFTSFDGYYLYGSVPKKIHGQSVIEYIAYDRISNFDSNADETMESLSSPITLYSILSAIALKFNYGLIANVPKIIEVNGARSDYARYKANPFPKGTTYRQIVANIAEFCGGNSHCHVYLSPIEPTWFTDQTNNYILTRDRYYTIEMSEETTTAIDSVELVSKDGNRTLMYPANGGNETYRMVDNPLAFFDTTPEFTQQQYIEALYNRLSSLPAYHPMRVEAIGFPWLEVGDIISVEYDDGQYVDMPIFSRTLTWNGGSLCTDTYECTGKKHRNVDENKNWTPNISNGQYDYLTSNDIKIFSLGSSQKLLTVADDDTICPIGVSIVNVVSTSDTSDLPSSSYKYGKAIVEKYASHRIVVTLRSVVSSVPNIVNKMDSSATWSGWKQETYTLESIVNASSSKQFTIPNNARIAVYTFGGAAAVCGRFEVFSSSTGSIVNSTPTASNISATKTTNKLTIANSNSSVNAVIKFIVFDGNVT